ncbi:DOMON-like domain-containing protein [Sphingobium subterraneum]|uniref:DOMON-like domain-containing protein n=1 Tax=Sphingobium subterraneum TaxID=627688 RepID=A0A841IYU3_9SPHN|nr:DOMON-like domain-containing protein [Sphingobium subterraneum]MBB6122446.1 hypothetical protein [Sphingobium subterraneum]
MDKVVRLICHPDTPARGVEGVEARVRVAAGQWVLDYAVAGARPLLPSPAAPQRTDGLWQTTCFELFIEDGTGDYSEFNFAPSMQWAAYRFSGYRQGMNDLPLSAPRVEPMEEGIRVTLDFPVENGARFGLSAVIEEVDGTKSCWALAHPPGKPDFHHPDCFALQVEAGDNS